MQIKTDRELLESYATDTDAAAFAELAARYSPKQRCWRKER
jgi:hypothetical protein